MKQKTLLGAMALITMLTVSVLSQNQIRTNVDLVVVPVTVRGEDGKLIAGLTQDDFRLSEDGKEQKITNFDADPQSLSAAIVVDSGMTSTQLNWLYPQGSTPTLYTLLSNFKGNRRARITSFPSKWTTLKTKVGAGQ
jgi:hypothetical protein